MTSLVLKFLVKVIAKLPIEVRSACGRALGAVYSAIPSRERKIAKLQLDVFVPEKGGGRLVAGVFANLGQTLLESLNLQPLLTKNNSIECPQLSEILEWSRCQNGTVALTAHFSNWELLAAYFAKQGVKLTVVGRPARSSGLQAVLAELRKSYGVETIWRTNGAGIRKIISTLKQGGVVAALIDQDTQVVSKPIEYFGVQAATPSGLLELGQRLGSNIVGCLITRTKLLKYKIDACKFEQHAESSLILSEFNRFLEQHVKNHPDQWVWFHKRWRTRPTQGKMSSHEYLEFLQTKLSQPLRTNP